VKESPAQDPETPVMVAGDPERKHLAIRQKKGIPIAPGAWEMIVETGEAVGINTAALESYIA